MKRAIVLAHYDPDGIVDPYVVRAVAAYRPLAERLVVVSASAKALPEALSGVVDAFLPRENVGYDFGSWRAGLDLLGPLAEYDEVICVNDSVYGPLTDLGPVLADPRLADADFWGMVRSGQESDHLQSWFLAFRRPVLASDAFAGFWRGVGPQPSKRHVVHRYEVGLSQTLLAAGFRMAAIYDGRGDGLPTFGESCRAVSPLRLHRFGRHRRFVARARPPFNPSELFWERIADAGVPYLKAGIFRVNHYRFDVRRVLARATTRWPAWRDAIHDHLARVGTADRPRPDAPRTPSPTAPS